MKNFNVEVFIKDLDKLFNDMQDKAIAGSENVATASWVIKQQQEEIEYWKDKFNKAMKIQEIKQAKYSDGWWKEVKEFNKKAQEK
jgi:t-SNARE complex subunit (syntaxin)